MKPLTLSASLAALATAAVATAQSSATGPPSGVSDRGLPSFSTPTQPTLSAPGLPSTGTATQPSLSSPGTPPLGQSFPPPPPLTDGLGPPLGLVGSTTAAGATDATTGTAPLPGLGASPFGLPTLATTPSRSPFDDGPIFVLQRPGMSLGSSLPTGLSGGLLDSLLEPTDPFALDRMTPSPGVSVASGATFSGGGAPFNEFCRPEDFTCR